MSGYRFDEVTTRAEAIALAQDILAGKVSRNHNVMLQTEPGADHRPQTLAAIAAADSADVVACCALAAVLA